MYWPFADWMYAPLERPCPDKRVSDTVTASVATPTWSSEDSEDIMHPGATTTATRAGSRALQKMKFRISISIGRKTLCYLWWSLLAKGDAEPHGRRSILSTRASGADRSCS